MSAPLLHSQHAQLPVCRSQALPRLHARSQSRCRTCTSAKKAATQEKPEEREERANPADLLSPYETLDDEGNPWWSPPTQDVWEGGAWEWLGRGGAVALPTLLAVGVVIGLFSAANYVLPDRNPQEVSSQPSSGSSESGLDLMLGSNGDSNGNSSGGSREIAPF